jgi:DNA-binding transcriptional ArsR family regulator
MPGREGENSNHLARLGEWSPRPVGQMVAAEAIAMVIACGVRVEMIELLARGRRSTGQIAELLGITLPHASNHLKVLLKSQMVTCHREGKNVIYELAPHASVTPVNGSVRVHVDDGDSVGIDVCLRSPLPEVKVAGLRPRADRTSSSTRRPSEP